MYEIIYSSVCRSVWSFARNSIYDSVYYSVPDSILDSIQFYNDNDYIRRSIQFSISASVWATINEMNND